MSQVGESLRTSVLAKGCRPSVSVAASGHSTAAVYAHRSDHLLYLRGRAAFRGVLGVASCPDFGDHQQPSVTATHFPGFPVSQNAVLYDCADFAWLGGVSAAVLTRSDSRRAIIGTRCGPPRGNIILINPSTNSYRWNVKCRCAI